MRLDEEQLSGSPCSTVEQPEGSFHHVDAAAREKSVGVGKDHRVPFAVQEAGSGSDHDGGIDVGSFLGSDEADLHTEEIRELGAHPLDTETRLPHPVRAALRAWATLLRIPAAGAGQGTIPSVHDQE